MKYYIEELRYCGPDGRTNNYIDFDRFEITTEPTRTNLSTEICLAGWLGISNDVSRYAHGVYDSLAAAEYAVQNLLGDAYRRDDEPSESPDVVAVYRAGRLPPVSDEALGIWLQDVDVPADADDAALRRQAKYQAFELEDTGVTASAKRIRECLESLRDDAREELED
ncbi:hypothetical protein [Thiolapillus sp.]|uniref:hypothetical protein n=1 Tax=Thiolapillus sp. TaxID=2017437 RepID=UPI003AF93299